MDWGAVTSSGGAYDGITRHAVDYRDRGQPMLLIADEPREFDTAIAAVGRRLLQRVSWADVAATLPQIAAHPVLAIEASGVPPAILDAVLPQIEAYLAGTEVPAIVALAEDQIDAVTGHLFGPRITLLLAPDMDERIAALVPLCERTPPALHEPSRSRVHATAPKVADDRHPFHPQRPEMAEDRLRTLEEGMTEIDRIVANLRRTVFAQGDPPDHTADRRRGYEGEPQAPTHPLHAGDVRKMIALRRLRSKFFGQFSGEMLFEDPAWDMLLDLFAAELENTRVSVSSLCIAAGVAPTTALRWIAKMTEMELFVRDPDPVDRRRAFMTLSPQASEAMRGYMHAARKITSRG